MLGLNGWANNFLLSCRVRVVAVGLHVATYVGSTYKTVCATGHAMAFVRIKMAVTVAWPPRTSSNTFWHKILQRKLSEGNLVKHTIIERKCNKRAPVLKGRALLVC